MNYTEFTTYPQPLNIPLIYSEMKAVDILKTLNGGDEVLIKKPLIFFGDSNCRHTGIITVAGQSILKILPRF